MTVVDWLILGVITISTLISIKRGFVAEALSLLTWVAAIVIARVFGADFTIVLEPYIDTPSLRLGASYVILFVVTLMLGGLVNYLIGEFVNIAGLSGLDRLLGIFFGLLRGALIIAMIVAGLHYLAPVKQDDWYRQSRLIPEIVAIIEDLGPLLWEQGERWLNEQAPAQPIPAVQQQAEEAT